MTRSRRPRLIFDGGQQFDHRLHALARGRGPEGADVLGQAAAAEAEAGDRNLRPIRSSMPIALASPITSAPDASHISAMTLMKEILVARKEFAATLTSSAVSRSIESPGMPELSGVA